MIRSLPLAALICSTGVLSVAVCPYILLRIVVLTDYALGNMHLRYVSGILLLDEMGAVVGQPLGHQLKAICVVECVTGKQHVGSRIQSETLFRAGILQEKPCNEPVFHSVEFKAIFIRDYDYVPDIRKRRSLTVNFFIWVCVETAQPEFDCRRIVSLQENGPRSRFLPATAEHDLEIFARLYQDLFLDRERNFLGGTVLPFSVFADSQLHVGVWGDLDTLIDCLRWCSPGRFIGFRPRHFDGRELGQIRRMEGCEI